MDEELRGMSVLEIDEVSMIEKLVLTHTHTPTITTVAIGSLP